ncbi:cytochrome c oxidase subunit I [Salinarchaeum sp. Harcht-Bsk1]|uniref:b(o/a)3-type cytochrome-c oxidase subunit 1 n=1 Tax=Salinarchaeum sp. Harcht-Bsk1 TaxID=1333523 RepID=UPI00034238F1|nr:b(o/a)3-type cytochrome-c oxidase subunit 1 [Salinarchaeum sp. Harcht-Bsk1]AGN00668.1 cytochrome c oxidase subunit I [Salinarchaeum sp. Harcht-Bsk1]
MTYVDEFPTEAKIVRWHWGVAFIALGLGGAFGLIQALFRTGYFRDALPITAQEYYTVLTGHGVLLALVFTTFFICGMFVWALTRSFDRELHDARIVWTGFLSMLIGTVLATIAILNGFAPGLPFGSSDVLYTFYSPMKAHPAFYVGAALLIVGSWIVGADYFLTFREWRADNPGARIPLQAFMVLTTWIMWYLATLGVAVEVVFFLIPWSFGWIETVDPLLTRSLFWFFGHPVVYFWLLPGYVAWYTILPKLAGGRLLSDPLARVVFVLFVLLSTPVGFHHQYVDPGIAEGFKTIAMTNTMMLLLPSFLTAFTVVASMEYGARRNGGKGFLKWLRSLPWGDPAFAGMALAGLMFAAGGFSGMINAGMNINYLIHNTLWVPGHFHLTVGTAFALTAMATTYWLYPQLTGKRLQHRTLALIQPYLWFIGMTLMSNAMHRGGLAGLPRRTAEPLANASGADAFAPVFGTIAEIQFQIALGATLLTTSLALFLVVVTGTWLSRPREGALRVNGDLPEALSGPEDSPRVLDNLTLWAAIAVLLVLIAYGVPLWSMVADGLLSPGSAPVPT